MTGRVLTTRHDAMERHDRLLLCGGEELRQRVGAQASRHILVPPIGQLVEIEPLLLNLAIHEATPTSEI